MASTTKKLEKIKKQIIITDKEDLVANTWLKNHPSFGESDQVVWVYEIVRNQFLKKLYKKECTDKVFRIARTLFNENY
jgi:DNA-directed RNA polymerase specialized sigma24 family protein